MIEEIYCIYSTRQGVLLREIMEVRYYKQNRSILGVLDDKVEEVSLKVEWKGKNRKGK